MQRHDWFPEGVCASRISVWLDGGVIRRVEIADACDGNARGLARLAAGRTPAELVAALLGIDCEGKGTSCPDQLARAVADAAGLPAGPE